MSKNSLTGVAAAAALAAANTQGPAVDRIAVLEQELVDERAALRKLHAEYAELQAEYLQSQVAALRYLAAVVFDAVGSPARSPELVEQAVERAIAAAVTNGRTDAEAKAIGYDVLRARSRSHGGTLTLTNEALQRAASMVIERAETEEGDLLLRVLTPSDLAERSVQALQAVPIAEEGEGQAIVEHKPVLAKAHNPLILPPGA